MQPSCTTPASKLISSSTVPVSHQVPRRVADSKLYPGRGQIVVVRMILEPCMPTSSTDDGGDELFVYDDSCGL